MPDSDKTSGYVSHSVLLQESIRGRVCVCPLGARVIVGSEPDAGFRVRHKLVSPFHCELITLPNGSVKLTELCVDSTTVNGVPMTGEVLARAGDILRLGPKVELRVLGVLDPSAPKRAKGMLNVPQWLEEQYLLLRVVGHGAAGLVYEAYDKAEDRRVAIKVLIAGGRALPQVIDRFRREAELQARLRDYPGIVSVYAFGTVPDSGELFCVMEYVTGNTLRDRVRLGLTRVDGVRLMARIARAADYAHENGLIHRDLKPANVMVNDKGVIRVTDFGLCKALEDEEGLTATGVMLGTPSYMAPEQIDDSKRVGKAADVYSLGAILYVILTSELPFQGKTLGVILDNVMQGVFKKPTEFDSTIDAGLEGICLKAMHHTPLERHASALEMGRALEAWVKRVAPPKRVTLRHPKK